MRHLSQNPAQRDGQSMRPAKIRLYFREHIILVTNIDADSFQRVDAQTACSGGVAVVIQGYSGANK